MTTADSHRPGAISAFFVYKAGLFAACFWGWLGFLAVRGGPVTGWHIVAATGAATTTLVGVVLGTRYALQRNAAARHGEIMRTLVEISWQEFASVGGTTASRGTTASAGTMASGGTMAETPRPSESRDGDADVIPLAPDHLRQRPRR